MTAIGREHASRAKVPSWWVLGTCLALAVILLETESRFRKTIRSEGETAASNALRLDAGGRLLRDGLPLSDEALAAMTEGGPPALLVGPETEGAALNQAIHRLQRAGIPRVRIQEEPGRARP